MAKEESKSVLEKAILEYKQILEVAKSKLTETHTKEFDEMITKLINENDLSFNKEPEMEKEESPENDEMKNKESVSTDKMEAINMKDATLKEIEEAFDAADDDDEFKVVKTDDENDTNDDDDFSLSDIENEITEVMSEIEAAETAEKVNDENMPEEEKDNLIKIKKIHEEMGKMIEAMDSEKNEIAMKENFHNKMMETFGEGYEEKIGMAECGKMYETFKGKSSKPKTGTFVPKSSIAKTFTPKSAVTPSTIANKVVEKPLNKAVTEMDEAPVEEAHSIGLSSNKLVSGTETPRLDFKNYAKNKVRLALQKEGNEKLQKRINSLVNENFELSKEHNKIKATVKEITKINESYRQSIDKYRKQLNEMALVSTNIANVNNILVNESLALSFEDKKSMINEFKKVTSVEDSEKTYNKLIKEFSETKKTIKESVEDKINMVIEPSSSDEVQKSINENVINEHVEKIKKLSTYKHKN